MSVTVAVELDETKVAILRELRDSDRTQGALIEFTESTRGKIQPRLMALRSADCIEYVHENTALYGITEKGRSVLADFEDKGERDADT